MRDSEHVIGKLNALEAHASPWQHWTADDFLPADLFAELVLLLPRLRLGPKFGKERQRVTEIPGVIRSIITDTAVLDTIRQRFGFEGGRVLAEVAWFGEKGYPAHHDRHDKLWNGQVYLDGDPKGTELFDADEKLAKVVEWHPNRFTCWLPPGLTLKHAAPASRGRYVLLWWILKGVQR